VFRRPELQPERAPLPGQGAARLHMDLQTDLTALSVGEVLKRAAIFFGWLISFMASMSMIGLIATVPLFLVAFMRLENREPWKLVMPMALCLVTFIYIVFDQLLTIPWPPTYFGDWFPALKGVIPAL